MKPERVRRSVKFRVAGTLGPITCSAFPELRVTVDGPQTVLAGFLPDRAALYGVLAQFEALNIDLLEVHYLG